MMLYRIFTLIYKETLAIWRDTKSRFVLIVPPLLQLIIFSMAGTLDVKNVPIAILNRDEGAESFELLQRFYGSPTFNKIVTLHSMDEIARVIDAASAVDLCFVHFRDGVSDGASSISATQKNAHRLLTPTSGHRG